MPVQIVVNQAGKPAGIAGVAREDLETGTNVTLQAVGGPFLQYLWSIIDRPVDVEAGVESSATLVTPTSSTTVLSPVDREGTHLVEVLVDSGNGLGATQDDVARVTFYAAALGVPLGTDPADLPRRRPAFQERLEHNVSDAIFTGGNRRGWAQEWDRWFAVIKRLWYGRSLAWGRVALTSGGASVVATGAYNVSVARVSTGIVDVTFLSPAANANYAVTHGARGSTGGSCSVGSETTNGFRLYRADPGGTLVDADFNFDVKHRAS